MYTVKLNTAEKKQGQIHVTIGLSDGTDSFVKAFVFSLGTKKESIKRQIKGYVESLESADVEISGLPIGNIDLSTIVDPVPTAATIAQDAWFLDFHRLERVQQLIDLGVLTGTEQKVIDLRASVTSDFLPAYITQM